MNDKVWQLDKRDVIPICDRCYNLLKDIEVFKYIGDENYRGFRSEQNYRFCWQDQNYCFFCEIKKMLEEKQ